MKSTLLTIGLLIYFLFNRKKIPVSEKEEILQKENILKDHILASIEIFILCLFVFSSHEARLPEQPKPKFDNTFIYHVDNGPRIPWPFEFIEYNGFVYPELPIIEVISFVTEEDKDVATRLPLQCSVEERINRDDISFLSVNEEDLDTYPCGSVLIVCSIYNCVELEVVDICSECDKTFRVSTTTKRLFCLDAEKCFVYMVGQ